jgi:hypothetical protein
MENKVTIKQSMVVAAVFMLLVFLWGTAGFLLFVSVILLLAFFGWVSKKPFLTFIAIFIGLGR